jgi:RNA polymerase sigma-70 factor (ECF subfamily)
MAATRTDRKGPARSPAQVGPHLELARAAAAGDNAAAGQLLREVAPAVGRVVQAILGGQHPDVDDAAQQALIGFVRALPGYRGDCPPISYATTIAIRSALAFRRRARLAHARHDPAALDFIATDRPSPGDQAAAERRKQALRDLLCELPIEQAEALAMRVVLGWSLEEIAVQANAPLNTVRSRLRLAKERLKLRIERDAALLALLEVTR